MNTFIRFLYSVLIGAAVAAFVGVGIFSLYQPPKGPEFPDYNSKMTSYYESGPNSPEFMKQQQEFERQNRDFQDKSKKHQDELKKYSQNVSVAVVALAVASLVLGVWMLRQGAEVMGEGLALGGTATSLYGIITASIADARVIRFLAVVVLLGSLLVIAKFKFMEWPLKKSKAKS